MNAWLEINISTKDGKNVRTYDNTETFIDEWRFWHSSGKECPEDESVFNCIECQLNIMDVDGAYMGLVRSGLKITFIYHKVLS